MSSQKTFAPAPTEASIFSLSREKDETSAATTRRRELKLALPLHEAELLLFRPEPVLMTCYRREHIRSHDTSIRFALDYDVRCFDQLGARRLRTSFGAPIAGLVVVEAKAPPGAETHLPRLIAPFRPALTKSPEYVMDCRLLEFLPGHRRDTYE
jgi:hypothetical protein